jgi:hypothetical protein
MTGIAKRIVQTTFLSVAVFALTTIARSSAAPAQEGGAKVCAPSVTGDKSIPNSGQYQYDCKMVMATCMLLAGVGTFGPNRDEMNSKVNLCIRRGIADDEREYEAWVKGGRVPVKPDPRVVEEQKKEMEAIQQEQQEHLAQERAVCTAGNTVRVTVRTSMWLSHGSGMLDRMAGYLKPGQIAQANGVDSTGNQCIVAAQSSGETVTGTVPLYGIEPVDQSAIAQQKPPANITRQCRRSGWMTVCTNIRN